MKKTLLIYIFLIVTVTISIFINGCSKVEDNLTTVPNTGTHPAGWSDETNINFHGKYIFDNKKWDMAVCKQCHGNDYQGGVSGISCITCHPTTPEDCRLCHGNGSNTIYPPKALNGETSGSYIGVGTHPDHLSSDTSQRISKPVQCVSCHIKLSGFSDPAHFGNEPDNIAEIIFDSLSITTTGGITPVPVWNRNDLTCSAGYCHGNFTNGTYRLLTNPSKPKWNDPTSVKCGSCHGDGQDNPLPGGTHPPVAMCGICHASVINLQNQFINKTKHVNGVIDYN